MKRFLFPTLLLVALAVSVGFYLQARRDLQSTTGDLTAQIQDLRQRLWNSEQQVRQLESKLAAATNPSPTATEPSPAIANSPAAGSGRGRGDVATLVGRFLSALDQPAVQGLISMRQREQLDATYGSLFKQLGLSPDELEKLKSLLVDRQSAGIDVLNAARDQGIDPLADPNAMRRLVAATQTKVDDEIKTLLGESDFAVYQTYNQTLPQRTVVNQLQQRLSYTDTPLSSDQAEQMVTILAANSDPSRSALQQSMTDFTVGAAPVVAGDRAGGGIVALSAAASTSRITDGAITQAQGVLSPPQLTALQQLQQEQQQQQQMGRSLRATNSDQSGGN